MRGVRLGGVTSRQASQSDLLYLAPRFWANVERGPNDVCWPWKKSVGSHGYGQTWDGTTVRLAHRVAWELEFDRIPPGLTVDHRCFVKRCCNPGHLQLLSNAENARNNKNFRRHECPQGHAYDDVNTYRDPKGHRRCRTCQRDRARARYAG